MFADWKKSHAKQAADHLLTPNPVAEPMIDRSDHAAVAAAAQQLMHTQEPMCEYTFCYTGKMDQNYVMQDQNGWPVMDAQCAHPSLMRDAAYRFHNHATGRTQTHHIGRTQAARTVLPDDFHVQSGVSVAFMLDGRSNWNVLADMGCGFTINMKGFDCCLAMRRWGVPVGEIESGEVDTPDDPALHAVYRVRCRRDQLEMMFLTCVCLVRTDLLAC